MSLWSGTPKKFKLLWKSEITSEKARIHPITEWWIAPFADASASRHKTCSQIGPLRKQQFSSRLPHKLVVEIGPALVEPLPWNDWESATNKSWSDFPRYNQEENIQKALNREISFSGGEEGRWHFLISHFSWRGSLSKSSPKVAS